jgi:hypothetical protein
MKVGVVCLGYDYRKVAGALVFVGGSQFVLGMLVAEALTTVFHRITSVIWELDPQR